MAVKASEILKNFSDIVSHAKGPLDRVAEKPCSAEHPLKNGLVYVNSPKFLHSCLEANVSILLISESLVPQVSDLNDVTILTTDSLQEAMARINHMYFPINVYHQEFDGHKVHPTATIAKSAEIGENCIIGPGAVIGENVKISKNCTIGPNAVIETNATLGEGTHIFALVYIGHGTKVGKFCIVQANSAIGNNGYGYGSSKQNHHFYKPHYGGMILEDRVEIGANTSIDRGAYIDSVIGEGTKIDNHCHIGHNIKCGKNCFITAGFISAGSVVIGDNCVFGGRNSVNNKISITDNCKFGGLTAQTNSIQEPGFYGGYPVQEYKDNLRSVSVIPHLPQMKRDLDNIKKKLNLDNK